MAPALVKGPAGRRGYEDGEVGWGGRGWVARRPSSCPESPWPEKAGEQVGTQTGAWPGVHTYGARQPVGESMGPGGREISALGRGDFVGVSLLQAWCCSSMSFLPPPFSSTLLPISCSHHPWPLPDSFLNPWSLVPKSEPPESPESFLSSPIPSSCPHRSPSPLSSSPLL